MALSASVSGWAALLVADEVIFALRGQISTLSGLDNFDTRGFTDSRVN